ncbi:hypothetical protein Bca52824_003227 [Brassica carinata]|uniref:Uncharacterized protein n=1 Tax=Brassica carinata TaxID=52824 RepID=A0A8X8BEJ4_BRACI|nr:hypothetical protein Bca52824_003227 [Brassica carinata]
MGGPNGFTKLPTCSVYLLKFIRRKKKKKNGRIDENHCFLKFQSTDTPANFLFVGSKHQREKWRQGVTLLVSRYSHLFSPSSRLAGAQSLAPAPAPTSDGTSIDQGIAYLLMVLALVLTYLIHPLDASSSYGFF